MGAAAADCRWSGEQSVEMEETGGQSDWWRTQLTFSPGKLEITLTGL
jgi:hypothetical protein